MKKEKIIKTNAMRQLDKQNIPYTVHTYEVDEDRLDALHVSHMMGVPYEEVFKTLVLHGDKTGYCVACLQADEELHLKHFAKISNNKRVELIALTQLEQLTGYIRGGCSPIGMKKKFPTFIERKALQQQTVRVSGGKRGLQIELSPDRLQKVTQANWFENKEL